MFDAGFTELILIFVLGLLILGPERLPRVAAQLGRRPPAPPIERLPTPTPNPAAPDTQPDAAPPAAAADEPGPSSEPVPPAAPGDDTARPA
jgi:hypothetical protein